MTVSAPNSELTIASDYLTALRDFALSKGISTRALLSGTTITVDTLLNPPKRLPTQVMHELFSNLYRLSENIYQLSIDYGRFIAMGSHGMLGVAVQSSKNLREAAALFVAYAKVRSLASEVDIVEDEKGITLVIGSIEPEMQQNPDEFNEALIFSELMLASNLALFVETVIGYEDFPEERPLCRFSQVKPAQEIIEALKTQFPYGEMTFNHPQMEIYIPLSWLNIPFKHDNEELLSLASEKCAMELEGLSPKDFIQEIRDRIHAAKGSKPSIELMAEQLFMSVSTLRRKLKAQQYTYQQIKQEERQLEAEQLLRGTQASIEDIAQQLGFSDGSNFSKSFKSWTGLTPVAFRANTLDLD